MSTHETGYITQHRQAQGNPSRGSLSAAASLRYGTAQRGLKSLPWPRNLFGEHATMRELLAPATLGEMDLGDQCVCGCGRKHRHCVPRIQPRPDGRGFELIYFSSIACEHRWRLTEGRLHHRGQDEVVSISTKVPRRSSVLASGNRAPEFSLHVTPDRVLSLRDLAGKPTIIAFYPADWSPVCGDQMTLYSQVRPEFQRYGAELIGISVDGAWCHQAFAQNRNIHFPLLSDFEPKGAVAKAYGAYRECDGVCERALFVIDRNGFVFWSYCAPIAVNPGADGILDALERMVQRGG